jgi:hypothetical protein
MSNLPPLMKSPMLVVSDCRSSTGAAKAVVAIRYKGAMTVLNFIMTELLVVLLEKTFLLAFMLWWIALVSAARDATIRDHSSVYIHSNGYG